MKVFRSPSLQGTSITPGLMDLTVGDDRDPIHPLNLSFARSLIHAPFGKQALWVNIRLSLVQGVQTSTFVRSTSIRTLPFTKLSATRGYTLSALLQTSLDTRGADIRVIATDLLSPLWHLDRFALQFIGLRKGCSQLTLP